MNCIHSCEIAKMMMMMMNFSLSAPYHKVLHTYQSQSEMNEKQLISPQKTWKIFLTDKCTTSNMQSEDEKNFFQFMEKKFIRFFYAFQFSMLAHWISIMVICCRDESEREAIELNLSMIKPSPKDSLWTEMLKNLWKV